MRDADLMQESLFTTADLENFTPVEPPVLALCEWFNAALVGIPPSRRHLLLWRTRGDSTAILRERPRNDEQESCRF
jgi:hypothetical protein